MGTSTADAWRRRARRFTSRWLPVGLLYAASASAAVEFTPDVSIGVVRTDNLALAAEAKEAETVYELIPAFTLTQASQRFVTNVAYRLEAFRYDGRSDSEIYHSFDGQVRAALDPENFFIELGGNRGQSIRDPLAPIPSSNLPITGNRVERDEHYLEPSFLYPIGANVTASGNYRRAWIQYAEDLQFGAVGAGVRDFDEDTFNFSLDNYRRERGFGWALRYLAQRTDYGVFVPWEYRQATVELGAWLGPAQRVFAAVGKESAWDDPFDAGLEDTFWEVGYSRSVDRLSAELAAGERTFGSSRRASISLAFQSGGTSFSYIEQPTTEGRNPYDRGGLLFPEEPNDFLTRPGSAERYVSKRLEWTANIERRRTSLSLTVFDEAREDRTAFDGTPLDDELQTGVYVALSRSLGAKTELRLDARTLRREFSSTEETDLTTVSLSAERAPSPRTQLTLEYAYTAESPVDGSIGLDYTARLVSVLLTRRF